MHNKLFFKAKTLLNSIPLTDLHLHTNYTDGQNAIEEMVKSAISKGLKKIAFTEHVRKNSIFFTDFMAEFEDLKDKYKDKIEIFSGVEVKAIDYNGNLDIKKEMEKLVDIIIGVAHTYPGFKGNIDRLDYKEALELEFKTLKGIIEKANVDIIGHIGGTCIKRFGKFNIDLVRELVIMCKEKGIVVEINSRYHKNLNEIMKIVMDINPYISLGSDAHSINEVGDVIRKLKDWSYA